MSAMQCTEMNSSRRRWNAAKDDEERMEAEIYKERLKEIEVAFRYNLSLLSERDTELDALEEQLRSGIAQIERLSQEKTVYEELLKRVDYEKTKEIESLRDELLTRERKMREMERRNEGNTFALKKKLQELKLERSEERATFEREKIRLEKYFIRAIRLKEAENAEGMNHMSRRYEKRIDEMEKERRGYDSVRVENRKLKKHLTLLRKEIVEKEKSYLDEINRLYGRVRDELDRMRTKAEVDTKETMTGNEGRTVTTQTIECEDTDRKEFLMIREQNDVLKSIIKNLKRTKVREESAACKDCPVARIRTEKLENEIKDLRKALESERCRRSEEEAIIQNLESSVVCLKEKLLTGLRRNTPESHVCRYDRQLLTYHGGSPQES